MPVGRGPECFNLSLEGQDIGTAHMGGGPIPVIGAASRKVVQTIGAEHGAPDGLKFTPDAKRRLASEIGGGAVIPLDTASRAVKRGREVGASRILTNQGEPLEDFLFFFVALHEMI